MLQILDSNPGLLFHLQQQCLIELIRKGNVDAAISFAQTELAPKAVGDVSLVILTAVRMWVLMCGIRSDSLTRR